MRAILIGVGVFGIAGVLTVIKALEQKGEVKSSNNKHLKVVLFTFGVALIASGALL